MLHLRRVMHLLADDDFDAQRLQTLLQEPYYVPEGTALTQQLLQFQSGHERLALVVNEYGDTVGLVTVEDILGEIIGEFTDTPTAVKSDVHPQPDGSCLVAGSASVRELNRTMGWDLPLSDAKTLNGAILEHLEDIPTPATSLLLGDYPVEIVQTQGNVVQVARIGARMKRSADRIARRIARADALRAALDSPARHQPGAERRHDHQRQHDGRPGRQVEQAGRQQPERIARNADSARRATTGHRPPAPARSGWRTPGTRPPPAPKR